MDPDYFDEIDEPVSWDEGCKKCSSSDTCDECAEGFWLAHVSYFKYS